MPKPLLLVPGAGLGAWAWSRVAQRLRAIGHDPHPLTLTGTGDRAHLLTPDVGIRLWVTDVVAYLESEELVDVVLVGHSFAGAVISGVAERTPERLARLVYLEGAVLRDGESVADQMGPEAMRILEAVAAEHDGWSLPWLTDEQLDTYYGDHGLSEEDLAWIRRHATPQPLRTYYDALEGGDPGVPRTYVRCTRTPVPPPIEPGTAGWELAELETGHWPMITAPRETADLLAGLADRPDP